MSDPSNGNLEVILVRMEAKLDRFGDRVGRHEQDMVLLRQSNHDLRNEITPIIMMDLPARIRVADGEKAEVHARLSALEDLEQRRKGAAALAKVLYTVLGAVGVGGAAAILRLMQLGGLG